ncbi:MAG: hypothetical protein AMXMBFR78_21900 [Rubrivivax sp.]
MIRLEDAVLLTGWVTYEARCARRTAGDRGGPTLDEKDPDPPIPVEEQMNKSLLLASLVAALALTACGKKEEAPAPAEQAPAAAAPVAEAASAVDSAASAVAGAATDAASAVAGAAESAASAVQGAAEAAASAVKQ